MPTRPINLDPNYSFPGGSQRRASAAPPQQSAAPQAPPPSPGMSADDLQGQIMRALGQPSSPGGSSGRMGGNTNAAPGPQTTRWGWDNFGITADGQGSGGISVGPWSIDNNRLIGNLPPMWLPQVGAGLQNLGMNTDSFQAGAGQLQGGSQAGNAASKVTDATGAVDAAAEAQQSQIDAMGSYLGQQLASTSADYQGNIADFALQRALLGDQSSNSKQGLQLSAAKQRELLDYQLKTGQRDLGLIGQERGLIDAGKGFAGRELELNKALRGLQHQGVGLNRKDIDLSDRNIEYDRADILTKYNADRRHANQAATAGGSWFAPERMLTQKDLYSNLMSNAGRLDTRYQHNVLDRGRADIEDQTIDNNAGRDQLGYDRSMNEIERALLANTQKANNVNDQSFSAQVNRNYLDPILANQIGGVDLGYRRGLLPIQTAERQNQQKYNDALAAWYAWAAQNGSALGAAAGGAFG